MKVTTSGLMGRLKTTKCLENFFKNNDDSMLNDTVGSCLSRIMAEKGMNASELAVKSHMSNFIYRILADQAAPSRNALIAVAFALEMNVEQTQYLLRIGSHARLDPRIHRDAAVIFAMNKGMDLPSCNDLLYALGEKTI